jgi:hypothetical protein
MVVSAAVLTVMPALVAGIPVFGRGRKRKTWIAGTTPAMTRK